jgi:hypothetical protein
MSGQYRPALQESREPSLAMSVGVLCFILLGMFVILTNVSIPDIQLGPELFADL